MPLSIQRKLLYSHFLAVVLVSGSIGTLFYLGATGSLADSLRARLKYSAALLGRSLDAGELAAVRGEDDTELPAYRDTLQQLRDFQHSNPDIAFIYVMRRDPADGKVSFVIDSDESAEQAAPGESYDDPQPALLAGFGELAADDELTADRWGYFLSGYAPLRNGGGEYLVGIDMRADEVARKFQRIRVLGAGSLLLSLLLAWLFSHLLARRITGPVRLLAGRAHEIAEGKLGGTVEVRSGDEIGNLASAFNTMSSRLGASQDETRRTLEELREARDNLEVRVIERTAELADANRQLAASNEQLEEEVSERRKAEVALAHAAATDALTGLPNRRALGELLQQGYERQRRGLEPFAVLLADLDFFKRINDQHGHEVGDRVLVLLAGLLRGAVRAQDAVGRWGGEEFLVLLPGTALPGALVAAEEIRSRVGSAPHRLDGDSAASDGLELPLSVSIGVATLGAGMDIDECLRRADAALYRAKAAGRNRVEADTV